MTLATVKKAKTVAKSSAKTVAKSVKGKAVAKPKNVSKTMPKTKAATGKLAGKPAAKPASKVVAKAVAKTAVKKPIKVTAKEKSKVTLKATPKATTKSAPKSVAKPVTKSAAKVAEPVAPKVAVKPIAKSTRSGTPLTEAELIKQAKSEYMSRDQLDFFKKRLMELQAQLRLNAGATTEHLRELAVAPDPADRATLEEEHALELRARDRERKLLKKVESAIQLIDSGEYGYCEETGEPIGIPRLLARPTATLTIEAQERRELKQKMYGE
jgi:DnaK suppressor protein